MNEEAGSDEDQRARNVVRGISSLTAQNLGANVLGLVFQVALIRELSLTQYGVYSALTVAVGIAGTLATMGLNQAVARYLSKLQLEDEQKSWVAVRRILYLAVSFTVAATIVYLLISPQLSLYFTKSTKWTGAFMLSGVWLFLMPIGAVSQGIVQGLRKYTLLATVLFLSKLAMVVFAIVAVLFFRTVDVAVYAWIIYISMITLWTFSISGGKLGRSKGSFEYIPILKYSYPLGIAATITIVAASADLVVVAGYLNTELLGVYNAAVTISTLLSTVFVLPLMTAFLPELSRSNEEKSISRGVRLAFRFLMLAVLPASLLVAAVPKQLIDLFTGGGAYLAGSSSLELIAFSYLFLAIQMILGVLFQATGRTVYAMIVGLTGAASDIGVSILLVPHLGLLGAASAKVSVALVGAFVGIYLAKRYLKMLDKTTFYVKGLVASVVPFLVTFLFSSYISVRVLTLFPYTLVFVALFLICLKGLRVLSEEDKVFISHLVPGSLKGFVKRL